MVQQVEKEDSLSPMSLKLKTSRTIRELYSKKQIVNVLEWSLIENVFFFFLDVPTLETIIGNTDKCDHRKV